MYFFYIDECGSTSADNDQRRFLSLTGVILHQNDVRSCDGIFNSLKHDYFGRINVELKSNYIRRKDGPLLKFTEEKYNEFLTELEDIVKKTPFDLITVIIDTKTYKRKSFSKKTTPHEKAYEILLKRFNSFLKDKNEKGMVVMDTISGRHGNLSRKGDIDSRMRYIHRKFQYMTKSSEERINRVIGGLYFTDSEYETGIQIADLCSYPFFYRFEYSDPSYRTFQLLVNSKLYKGKLGNKPSAGFKVYPRNPYGTL